MRATGEGIYTKLLTTILLPFLVKLKLTGQNLSRVFNSRLGRACINRAVANITKQPNIKLKTRPKQLLGSLQLVFAPSKPFLSQDILQLKKVLKTITIKHYNNKTSEAAFLVVCDPPMNEL